MGMVMHSVHVMHVELTGGGLGADWELTRSCDWQVNPLAETSSGELVAADAKLGFDDNAAFRQGKIFAMRDTSQEDPRCASPPSDAAHTGFCVLL